VVRRATFTAGTCDVSKYLSQEAFAQLRAAKRETFTIGYDGWRSLPG
jgi:hypothetical protein